MLIIERYDYEHKSYNLQLNLFVLYFRNNTQILYSFHHHWLTRN
jgi:hypothetical protein